MIEGAMKQGIPREPSIPNRSKRRERWRRVDRIVADLNVLLVMFAIGLAMLDLTFIVTQRLVDRLPEVTRVVYVAQPEPPNVITAKPGFP
jgi:hypothetical protein